MSVKPILFNTEMVRAILDGRKTVTRRVVKPQPERVAFDMDGKGDHVAFADGRGYHPPYRPGDVLYVRETWARLPVSPGGHTRISGCYYYKADGETRPDGWRGKWRPSIHMPREAARIWLRVTDVRVERLWDMSEDDVLREGFKNPGDFIRLWDSTIKPADRERYGWSANPWVWGIAFERYEKPKEG